MIQISAVHFKDGEEVGAFDSYVYTDVPLKSFINGLTGITSETLKDAPKVEEVLLELCHLLVIMQQRVIYRFY